MRLAQRQRIEGGRTSGPTRAMTTSDQDIDRIPSNGVDGGWNPWERQALNAQVRLASGQTLRSPAYTSMSPSRRQGFAPPGSRLPLTPALVLLRTGDQPPGKVGQRRRLIYE
jgi:hypothetical protein